MFLNPNLPPLRWLRLSDIRFKSLIAISTTIGIFTDSIQSFILLSGALAVLFANGQGDNAITILKKIKWSLAVLFVVDWFLVDFHFAHLITFRILLLSLSFLILTSGTQSETLYHFIRWLRVPASPALGFVLGFQSVQRLQNQWRSVVEAQYARGMIPILNPRKPASWPDWFKSLRSIIIPALVLAVRRAWQASEAAQIRGIRPDSRTVALPSPSPSDMLALLLWSLFWSATLFIIP